MESDYQLQRTGFQHQVFLFTYSGQEIAFGFESSGAGGRESKAALAGCCSLSPLLPQRHNLPTMLSCSSWEHCAPVSISSSWQELAAFQRAALQRASHCLSGLKVQQSSLVGWERSQESCLFCSLEQLNKSRGRMASPAEEHDPMKKGAKTTSSNFRLCLCSPGRGAILWDQTVPGIKQFHC